MINLKLVADGSAASLKSIGIETLGQLIAKPRADVVKASSYLGRCWDQALLVLGTTPAVFPVSMQARTLKDLSGRTAESLLTLALYEGAADTEATRAALVALNSYLIVLNDNLDAAWFGKAEATLAFVSPRS